MAANNNSWDWDNENLTDLPPAYVSRSVWDEWLQSEADAHTLLSSASSSEVKHPQLSLQNEGKIEPLSSSASRQARVLSEGSPRCKRRRTLLFPGDEPEDGTVDSTLDSDSLPGFTNNCNCKDSRCDDMLQLHPESTLTTCLQSGRNDKYAPGEQMYWSMYLQNELGAIPHFHPQMNSLAPVPIGNDHDPAGERSTIPQSVIKPKLVTPVAYPFAVLKPCGVAGDVTLNDINKRILMPPKRPILHPVGDYAKPPSASSTGSGLSGKAVVALTKIHTEGKGTITIMRTKG